MTYVDKTPYVILMWSMRANLSYLNIRRCDTYVNFDLSQINLILWDIQKKLLDIISTIPIGKWYFSQNMQPL